MYKLYNAVVKSTAVSFELRDTPIVDYFQRGELMTSEVSPVLLAMATLQAMMRSSPLAHLHCYSDGVQLLEYINSQCPRVGRQEQYIHMLVDFKTRVSSSTTQPVGHCSNMHIIPYITVYF